MQDRSLRVSGRALCASYRHKVSEIDENDDEKESAAAAGRDPEVTSRRRASKRDRVEEKRPIPSRLRHVHSRGTSTEIDELDYKKSKLFIRYVSSRRKLSENPGESTQKKSVADRSSSDPSRHKDAGDHEYDEEIQTEQEGRSVISGFHYVDPGKERHKGPHFDETETMHVGGGEVLGSFRCVGAHNTPKELTAAENLFSSDSQALIRLARNYEIRRDDPHDTNSQDRNEEGKPEKQLQASPLRRGRAKVRFVSPVLNGSSSPSRKTFTSNDRFCSPPPHPHSSEAEDNEEDPEAQKWNEVFRGDRIDAPTSDPRKGKFPAGEHDKEQNDQDGNDKWAFNGPGNLLSPRRNASPQSEGRGQFRSRSCSRGRSDYEAYHAYHNQPPTPPPVPSPPLSRLDRLHSQSPANAWRQNPNPGETKTFSECSVVGEEEKEIRRKDSASDSTSSNGEAEPKTRIDGADEQGWRKRGIWQ